MTEKRVWFTTAEIVRKGHEAAKRFTDDEIDFFELEAIGKERWLSKKAAGELAVVFSKPCLDENCGLNEEQFSYTCDDCKAKEVGLKVLRGGKDV